MGVAEVTRGWARRRRGGAVGEGYGEEERDITLWEAERKGVVAGVMVLWRPLLWSRVFLGLKAGRKGERDWREVGLRRCGRGGWLVVC